MNTDKIVISIPKPMLFLLPDPRYKGYKTSEGILGKTEGVAGRYWITLSAGTLINETENRIGKLLLEVGGLEKDKSYTKII